MTGRAAPVTSDRTGLTEGRIEDSPRILGDGSSSRQGGIFGWREAGELVLVLFLACAIVLGVGFAGTRLMPMAWDGTQWVSRDTPQEVGVGPPFSPSPPIP